MKEQFTGIFPFLKEFNQGLYGLFSHVPLYIGKFFVGFFYGILFGFLFSFWKREIFFAGLLITITLMVLNFFGYIKIYWDKVSLLFGLTDAELTKEYFFYFCNAYFFEISVFFVVGFFFYKTVQKYR